MAKMIAKDALLELVKALQERRAEETKIDADVERAKATLAAADEKRKAASEAVNAAYQAIVDEVGEELARMFDAKPAKPAKAGGTRTRMGKEQTEKVKSAVLAIVSARPKSNPINKSGLVELLAEQGLTLPANPSYLTGLVKAKLIAKSGEKAATVYYAK